MYTQFSVLCDNIPPPPHFLQILWSSNMKFLYIFLQVNFYLKFMWFEAMAFIDF